VKVPTATGVTVRADATRALAANVKGVTAGGLAAGAAISIITTQGTARATIGDFANLNVAGAAGIGTQGVNVLASASDTLTAEEVAVVAGIVGVGVNEARANSGTSVDAGIGNSVAVKTSGAVVVNATFTPRASARALGVGVGVGAAVAVSIAYAGVTGNQRAHVDANARFDAASLAVTATRACTGASTALGSCTAPSTSAHATGGAGGGLVGVNAAEATTRSEGSVTARIDNGVTFPAGGVRVVATDVTRNESVADGASAGLIAAGAILSHATSNVQTRAELGNGLNTVAHPGKALNVDATGFDSNRAYTKSGSGGVINGNAAIADTKDTSSATVQIGASVIVGGDVTFAASHTTGFAAMTDSVTAAALNASGAASTNVATTSATVPVKGLRR
jgi:hypothetical protein